MTKSSAIIKHIISLRDARPDAEKASLAYFFFDFRDKDKKQDIRNFITSLLVQLSTHSIPCCKIISDIYSTHGNGAQQPSIGALKTCLREMLAVTAHNPIYIIVDALDECPNLSGVQSPRAVVLSLLKDLINLRIRNLHICVTSRPEVDIQKFIGPLAHSAVSLHEESGQMKDISEYIRNVVYSEDSDSVMLTWRSDQKELVIEELSEKADGMYAHHPPLDDRSSYLLLYRFRWVFCQLEVLRHCFPASIRRMLNHLPESLDETYLHVLRQISQANKAHAHRMLQCILVAVRPLRVEELAEVLAFEFDEAYGEIPKYRAAWKLDDQTQAVLSTCSSLVTIVDGWYLDGASGSRQLRQVVQFSHFSVKEFLMSNRLGDLSYYHIHPLSAHTLLTQACLGVLIHLDDNGDKRSIQGLPLAMYAAQHWVEHAKFESVASRVKDGIETLFDPDTPHFAAWVGIYDLDNPYGRSSDEIPTPLYYSALCGFYDLVKRLAVKCPEHVNAIYGRHKLPLFAALEQDHVEIMEFLLEHGANVDARETTGETMLLKVLSQPERHNLVEIVALLLKHGANANARTTSFRRSLHLAEYKGEFKVAQMLLDHKSDVNFQDIDGRTPLHIVLGRQLNNEDGALNHARLLFERGAEVNRHDKQNQTPLLLAMGRHWFKLARILLEKGAEANAQSDNGKTSLHILLECRTINEDEALNYARLLFERGADVNRRDNDIGTPLHLAIRRTWFKFAQILLEHGADTNAQSYNHGKTPLHILLERRTINEDEALNCVQLLFERGVDVNRRDIDNETPLHLAIRRTGFKFAQILLEHGADTNAQSYNGKTSLHILLERRTIDEDEALNYARLLFERGADVNSRDNDNETPLHLAIRRTWFTFAQILLRVEHGVDTNAQSYNGETPLHILLECRTISEDEALNYARLLFGRGTEVNNRDKNCLKYVQILLEHSVDANVETSIGNSPLHMLSKSRTNDEGNALDHALLLLKLGADVNKRNKRNETPLHLAIRRAWFRFARILLDHGADAIAKNNCCRTPLHVLSERENCDKGNVGDSLKLLEYAADVNRQYHDTETSLFREIGTGMCEFLWNLLTLTQVLTRRKQQAKLQRSKYHKDNMARRNAESVLHNYHSSVA